MLLLALSLAVSQPQMTANNRDAASLIQRVLEFQPTQQAMQREYGFIESITEDHLRGDGSVNKRKQEAFSVSPSPGGEYRRLIGKNGNKLSEKDAAKEEKKFRKFLEKQAKLDAKEREKQASKLTNRVSRYQDRLRQALEVLDFTPETDIVVSGVPVRVFRFEPKSDYEPHSRATNILSRIEGTIAIDPERNQVARLEIRFRENMGFLGGVFGKIYEGSTAVAEAKPDEDVWLLERIDVQLRARFYFLKRYRRHLTYVYSDYRRFTVETDESYKKRKKN